MVMHMGYDMSKIFRISILMAMLILMGCSCTRQRANIWCEKALQEDDLEKRIGYLTKALNLDSECDCKTGIKGTAFKHRGTVYAQNKYFSKAVSDFTNAIELNPKDEIIHYKRGNVYQNIDFDRAIKDYDKAIELNPEYADAYYNRGYQYMQIHEYDKALKDFSKSIRLNPKEADVYVNRGYIYFLNGDIKSASADFDKAKELVGGPPSTLTPGELFILSKIRIVE
jgi:tetratricopeptide (TPR) repeat protein